MKRRTMLQAAIPAATYSTTGRCLGSELWPTRPVRFLVPYPAGGPFDVLLRPLCQGLTQLWQQPALVDNKPGANEAIAADSLTRAAPDGHTLLMCTESAVTLNPLLFKRLTYDPQELAPVSWLVAVPLVLVVPSTSPVQSIEDWVQGARARAARPMLFGSGGVGNPTHLGMAKLLALQRLTMVHVPYKGGAPMVQGMLSGEIDCMMLSPSAVAAHVRSGRLRGLAVTGSARVSVLPQVPTFAECGMREMDDETMVAIFARRGTPDHVRLSIAMALRSLFNAEGFVAQHVAPFGMRTIASTPSDLEIFLRLDRPRQAEKVRTAGAFLD